ncbi:4'-phosphopantetheinyl transferase superfamily protein [Candidatus Dependentiae bacterium]|nr:MAG: 4'-phosphopantetheinyl transferase superfamily protein [Candidatus Dependentiae bacterium]
MMKQSVGVDIVQVKRFEKWKNWSDTKLKRIFSTKEIAYAKSNMIFCAQRLAVRFAAKEAFFKAFQHLFPQKKISLLKIMLAVSVEKRLCGRPYLKVAYDKLFIDPLTTSISISHTDCCAIAVVQLHSK